MRVYHPPFVAGETLILLYPELAPFLHTVPNHIEEDVRVYDAFIALDVVNALKKAAASQTDQAVTKP